MSSGRSRCTCRAGTRRRSGRNSRRFMRPRNYGLIIIVETFLLIVLLADGGYFHAAGK